MVMSFGDAAAQVAAPGGMFEMGDAVINGWPQRVFVRTPRNLGTMFRAAPSGATFIVHEAERWTFEDVRVDAAALGAALTDQFGVGKGDRVAIMMRNVPEWIVGFAAVTSIGAVVVSMNAWWTPDEIDFALRDSGASVLLVDGERVERSLPVCVAAGVAMIAARSVDTPAGVHRWADVVVRGAVMPDVDVDPDDDATILYTSGTTGRPKGAVSTHGAVIQSVWAFAAKTTLESIRQPSLPNEHPKALLLTVPLFHVTGCVAVMLGAFAFGLKLAMMHRWDADEALAIIERERITNILGVPTQAWDIVHSPRFAEFDVSSLRELGGGGAPAPPALMHKVNDSVTDGGPYIGYGMTETNAYGPGNRGQDYLDHPTSVGQVFPIMEMQIRDSDGRAVGPDERGEIWFKGPNLIRSYWNRPDATAATLVGGWLRSGDLGRIDRDGFIYIEDRITDMILRAGENIYCAEVEAAIYEHPAVYEAAVFGLPHQRLGEEVAAAIVVHPGMTIDADALRDHVRARLAPFKVPARVFLRDEPLPRNPARKVLKRQLAAEHADAD